MKILIVLFCIMKIALFLGCGDNVTFFSDKEESKEVNISATYTQSDVCLRLPGRSDCL